MNFWYASFQYLLCFLFVVIYWQSAICAWKLAVPVLDLKEICANIVGEQMDKLYPYSKVSVSVLSGKSSFLLLLAAAFPLFSPRICCRQPGLWSLPVHLGAETLSGLPGDGVWQFWCLAAACSTSILVYLHWLCTSSIVPWDFTYKHKFEENVLVISSWWQQNVKPSLGDLLIMQICTT